MKLIRLVAIPVAMACLIACALSETYTGTIVRTDASKKTFTLKAGGRDVTFQIDGATKFLDNGAKPSPMLGDLSGFIWKSFRKPITVSSGPNLVAETVKFPVEIRMSSGPPPPGAGVKTGSVGRGGAMRRNAGGSVPDPESMVGKALPAFEMKTINGKSLASSMIKGRVVVLDFWATWCEPCKMVSPIMQYLHRTLDSKGVIVIGAGTNEKNAKGKIKKYATVHGYTYAMTYDNDALAEKLGVTGIPCMMVIDKKGIIRQVHVGYASDLKTALGNEVRRLLAK